MSVQCATTPSTRSAVYWLRGASVTGFASRSASRSRAFSPRCSASKRMSTARLRALERAATSAHAAEVRAVAGVDLDLGPLLEEERDVDLGAGLERGGLGATGGAVALQARLGVGDLEDDRGRQLDVEHRTVVRRDLRGLVLEEVVGGVADGGLGDADLVVGRAVHEDVVGPVLVEVLHVATVDVRGLDLDARVEGLVDDLAGQDVLELGPHERRALAGLDVLELHDGPELALEVEDQAVLEVVGRCHGVSLSVQVRRLLTARSTSRYAA